MLTCSIGECSLYNKWWRLIDKVGDSFEVSIVPEIDFSFTIILKVYLSL